MTKRVCKDSFLMEYLRYTQETEVPDYFGLWVGLSIVCTCLGRKTFIVTRPTIYPNHYIILVANSGLCRKSTAIDQGIGIMESIDDPPRVLAQKTTTEAMIEQLKTVDVPTIRDTKKGLVVPPPGGAQAIIVADELATLLNKEAFRSGFIGLLTKIWDSSKRDFVYHTRGHGSEIIREPCINLLAGSTASWLKSSIPEESIGGGFTSRIIFVQADRPDRFHPWPNIDEDVLRREGRLIHDLNCIRALEGEFRIEPEARTYFAETYKTFLTQTTFSSDFGLAGYASRRHVMLHKTAMAFSASESDDMIITKRHYEIADSTLQQTERYMPAIVESIMSTVDGESLQDVLLFIKSEGEVTRTRLTRKFQHKMKVRVLDELLQTLETGGSIAVTINGRVISYIYTGALKDF